MRPSSKTHWRVEGTHPYKIEPFDVFINFYTSLSLAQEAEKYLEEQGYEHIIITPPGNLAG